MAAQLTGLWELYLGGGLQMKCPALLQLTALTALTELELHSVGIAGREVDIFYNRVCTCELLVSVVLSRGGVQHARKPVGHSNKHTHACCSADVCMLTILKWPATVSTSAQVHGLPGFQAVLFAVQSVLYRSPE